MGAWIAQKRQGGGGGRGKGEPIATTCGRRAYAAECRRAACTTRCRRDASTTRCRRGTSTTRCRRGTCAREYRRDACATTGRRDACATRRVAICDDEVECGVGGGRAGWKPALRGCAGVIVRYVLVPALRIRAAAVHQRG